MARHAPSGEILPDVLYLISKPGGKEVTSKEATKAGKRKIKAAKKKAKAAEERIKEAKKEARTSVAVATPMYNSAFTAHFAC